MAGESDNTRKPGLSRAPDRGGVQRKISKPRGKRVRRTKGSPGVDGMTLATAKDYLREQWPNIRSRLLDGTLSPPAAAGQTGGNPQAGRRGQKTRRAMRHRQTDPASLAAGSPKALGPNVFRTQLRLPARTLRSSSGRSGPTLHCGRPRHRGRFGSLKVFRPVRC